MFVEKKFYLACELLTNRRTGNMLRSKSGGKILNPFSVPIPEPKPPTPTICNDAEVRILTLPK